MAHLELSHNSQTPVFKNLPAGHESQVLSTKHVAQLELQLLTH